MDDIVKMALQKWPNVPHCYRWLALDARGHWYMRDDRTQSAGPFPQSKGSRIDHEGLIQFIQRNYMADSEGAWFFQNGPQRVYVDLEATPWIYRTTDTSKSVLTHTGLADTVNSTWLDEFERLYVHTSLGLGLVHTQDMHQAAALIEHDMWPTPSESHLASLCDRFLIQRYPVPK